MVINHVISTIREGGSIGLCYVYSFHHHCHQTLTFPPACIILWQNLLHFSLFFSKPFSYLYLCPLFSFCISSSFGPPICHLFNIFIFYAVKGTILSSMCATVSLTSLLFLLMFQRRKEKSLEGKKYSYTLLSDLAWCIVVIW